MAVSTFHFLTRKTKKLFRGLSVTYSNKGDISVPIINDFHYIQHSKSNKKRGLGTSEYVGLCS